MGAVQRLCAKKERRLKLVSQEETIAELNKLISRLRHEIDGKDQTIRRLQQCKPSLVANELQTSTLKKYDEGVMKIAVMEITL